MLNKMYRISADLQCCNLPNEKHTSDLNSLVQGYRPREYPASSGCQYE